MLYDGTCALCHGATRFLLKRDPAGSLFVYAPLQGTTATAEIPEALRPGLPDSVVVKTATGEILTRWAATLHLLARVGGPWRGVCAVLRLVPRGLGDRIYDAIAAVRYRVFGREKDACPILPPDLRARFLP